MTKKQLVFVEAIKKFYTEHGRHNLPWRQTTDPYKILVSEVMLQQTQVVRVTIKYEEFLKAFPTVESLAHSSLGAVLTAWQGLGYNRRAKMLHMCAQTITEEFAGVWPRDIGALKLLPGVGAYTAGAVAAFAFSIPSTIIETNIRTVYLHHFFPKETNVSDATLLPIITVTLDQTDPRSWYYALMDYGSHLKATIGNINTQSKHYAKQSKFEGSDRQIRGAIIRTLSTEPASLAVTKLEQSLKLYDTDRVREQLKKLVSERMVEKVGTKYQLPK